MCNAMQIEHEQHARGGGDYKGTVRTSLYDLPCCEDHSEKANVGFSCAQKIADVSGTVKKETRPR